MKYVAALLLLLGLAWATMPSVEAAPFCRAVGDRQICILSIKRSAKNYWEYRAIVSVEGIARPLETYNCRDRLWVSQDGKVVKFEPYGAGEMIFDPLPALKRRGFGTQAEIAG